MRGRCGPMPAEGYEMTDIQPPPPPRPMPKPGPPRPAARPVQVVGTGSDPRRFGRVDPDGTVWLVTSSGERGIGSWAAGDPDAAFAHFGRRYDDLSTEIDLLEHRLNSG